MAGLSLPTSKDPLLTRKASLSHPGTLLLGAVAILFAADVLGYVPQLDDFLSQALAVSRAQGLAIVAPVLFGLVGLFSLFLLLLLLRTIGSAFRSLRQRIRFSGRTTISLENFTRSAEQQGIRPCIAQETYRLLTPYYPGKMSIQMQDHLWHQLRLSEENILFLQSNLLNRCDRREVLFFSADNLHTILDLMRHVETAPPQHVRETGPTGDHPVSMAASSKQADTMQAEEEDRLGRRDGDRLPAELAERRLAPPDGGLHGAPFPGRRRGDYTGARRRTGDLSAAREMAGSGLDATFPMEKLPQAKAAFFHPRNRSTDFTPRRRGDLPSTKPRD